MNNIGVYLTRDVIDIFDKIIEDKSNKLFLNISKALYIKYLNAPQYSEKITLNTENLTEENLKKVFKQEYSDIEISSFVKSFKKLSIRMGKNKSKNTSINNPIKFTDDFWILLDRIDDEISWEIIYLESSDDAKNVLDISKMDISDSDYYFDIYFSNGKKSQIKISEFIRIYFPNKFLKDQINNFIKRYNKTKSRELDTPIGNVIDNSNFVYNPNDIRSTFISLTTRTYPHGTETEVLDLLPKDLKKDEFGNYYKIIGDSTTMFTSHLDTASRSLDKVKQISVAKDGQEIIMTDGKSILGADDKAGVTILLYMMHNNIPGIYYFFIGEERGCIGSTNLANNFLSISIFKKIKKVISFDRKNYYSVITSQMGMECCSDEFAQSLCNELNKSGLKMNIDPTGVVTDSAMFMDIVPECTNISVGYFNEHTHDEVQNITFLTSLAKACLKVNWEDLTVSRKLDFDEISMGKWSDLISSLKALGFYNNIIIKGSGGKIEVSIEFDDISFNNAYDDLSNIDLLLAKHKCDPDIVFDQNIIKMKLP